jgi:hypothetical protein
MSLSSRMTSRMYRMREGNVHGLLYGQTQSNYSKQVLTNSDYGNDESRSCKILPANHLHKNLSHNARRLECDDCARLSLTGTLDSEVIARGYASYRRSSFFTKHPV